MLSAPIAGDPDDTAYAQDPTFALPAPVAACKRGLTVVTMYRHTIGFGAGNCGRYWHLECSARRFRQ